MSSLRPERFFSLDATTFQGTHGYVAEMPEALEVYDLAWLVALMDTLKKQFESDLVDFMGPDRAYLLVEYQRQTLAEFTQALAAREAAETPPAPPDPTVDTYLQAKHYIKQENPDLFSEGQDQ